MSDHPARTDGYPKTAACLCGNLTVTVSAAPWRVHACTCLDCQRRSGSALSYTAFFDASAASVSGQFRSFRRTAESGRWHESSFCSDCGCTVFIRMEAFPDGIAIPVGNFADPHFAKPALMYWSERRHGWLSANDMEMVERQ